MSLPATTITIAKRQITTRFEIKNGARATFRGHHGALRAHFIWPCARFRRSPRRRRRWLGTFGLNKASSRVNARLEVLSVTGNDSAQGQAQSPVVVCIAAGSGSRFM